MEKQPKAILFCVKSLFLNNNPENTSPVENDFYRALIKINKKGTIFYAIFSGAHELNNLALPKGLIIPVSTNDFSTAVRFVVERKMKDIGIHPSEVLVFVEKMRHLPEAQVQVMGISMPIKVATRTDVRSHLAAYFGREVLESFYNEKNGSLPVAPEEIENPFKDQPGTYGILSSRVGKSGALSNLPKPKPPKKKKLGLGRRILGLLRIKK